MKKMQLIEMALVLTLMAEWNIECLRMSRSSSNARIMASVSFTAAMASIPADAGPGSKVKLFGRVFGWCVGCDRWWAAVAVLGGCCWLVQDQARVSRRKIRALTTRATVFETIFSRRVDLRRSCTERASTQAHRQRRGRARGWRQATAERRAGGKAGGR